MLSYRGPGARGRLALGTAAAVAACALAARTGAAVDPDALARALQRKYETIRDFRADFVHSYAGGVLRKRVTERGRVLVKKPGMMRWTYTHPDEKVFVSDGRKLYSWIPADRQVIVTTVPAADEAPTPALFLAGKGSIVRDFTAQAANVPAGAPAGSVALRLVPKQRERDYDWLVIVMDEASLQLRMLITGDRQGGESTFTFSRLEENVGLPDREFAFKMPRGADVITDSPRPR